MSHVSQISPWIPIAISVVTTVVVALVGFIVKRELGRLAADNAELKKANEAEAKERREAMEKLSADLKAFTVTCEDKYLSKEMFHTLEQSRKEVEEIRRAQDGRLESLITDLLSKYGGQGGA